MRIVAFDFDGTLSDSEMTVLLGERMDVAEEMGRITARAMNDEIGYAESLRERARLLEGLDVDSAENAYGGVRLRSGAANLLRRLDDYGHHLAVLTGGFDRGVERALETDRVHDAVDTVVANRLPTRSGRLTGEVEGPLVEGTKDRELERLAEELDVPLDRTVAVGDGANDLPMLEVAGFAVGVSPKPAVASVCDATVESMGELADLFEERNLLDPEA